MTSVEPYRPQRIGNLRERVTIIVPGEQIGVDPDWNTPIYSEPEERAVWARVEPLKGGERLAAGTIGAWHEVTFHCRFMADIKATWEIEHRGNRYNVTSWRNLDERRRFISIDAKGVTEQ